MQDNVDFEKYSKNYSDENFGEKLKHFATKAGVKVVYSALKLYLALQSDSTPAWAKTVIMGALGYFILPVDLIPDLMPAVGFTDDLGVIAAALATVASHVTPLVKEQAREKTSQWFGKDATDGLED